MLDVDQLQPDTDMRGLLGHPEVLARLTGQEEIVVVNGMQYAEILGLCTKSHLNACSTVVAALATVCV